MAKGIDYEGLIREIEKCCLECDVCELNGCLIGFCKKNLMTALKNNDEFIPGGLDNLPLGDVKVYQEENVIDFVGFLLNQCRNCHFYHDEDCIVNIVRSALEVILVGEPQEYGGSNVKYLSELKNVNSEIADKVLKAFQDKKNS